MNGEQPVDEIEPGRRLVRLDGERAPGLFDRVAEQLQRLSWRTRIGQQSLQGRFPLKLLAVLPDPIVGDAAAGSALLRGQLHRHGTEMPIDFTDPTNAAYLQHFAWLRDLAAAAPRDRAAPVAEQLMRHWLAAHGDRVTDDAWRADRCGWRILNWVAHAPLILSSRDIVYRSAVLNALARQARFLDKRADKAAIGMPRLVACAGRVVAGLLLPGGASRQTAGEAALACSIAAAFSSDGGIVTRSPNDQMTAITVLTLVDRGYDVRRQTTPEAVTDALSRAVAAWLGLVLGDGALSSWEGSGPIARETIEALVAASRVRTRPLRQAREWGYQRLSGGATTLVVDAGAPPPSRVALAGNASTLAFELSDGATRVIVNCGGADGVATLPRALAQGLRTTAAHSTLVLGDANSTAVLDDGRLGAGVTAVDFERQELDGGSRLTARHDGYAKRFGLSHARTLTLSSNGRELAGEDALVPTGRRKRSANAGFAIRFHLGIGVEPTLTADNQAALLRVDHGPLWQFRCRGGTLSIEESVWIDARGRMLPTVQIVVSGKAPPGGASVSWLLKRAS